MTVLTPIDSEQAEPVATDAGPGAMLRKERLAQGLDRSRAAAQLHLSDSLIEALEADDFEALPGAVFTQGYLRNYARLLGLSEKKISDAYHRSCPQADPGRLKASGASGIVQEVRSSNRMMQLTTWMIVIGLLALVGLWWQDRLSWEETTVTGTQYLQEPSSKIPPPSQDEVTPVQDSVSAFPPSDGDDVVPDEGESGQVESDQGVPPSSLSQPGTPREAPLPEEVSATATPTETAPRIPVATEQTAVPFASLVEREEAMSTKVSQTSDATEPTSPANADMVFEFTGPCWAEVRDSTGKAQIIGEMGEGDQRSVPANLGPFKIVLGNIKFARLTIGGKPFDLTSKTRGVVARFTLDPEKL